MVLPRRIDGYIDSYLRARASYTDGEGSDKSADGDVGQYSVQQRPGARNSGALCSPMIRILPLVGDQDTAAARDGP